MAVSGVGAGITAWATGGDFWTGFQSGAYNQLYNWRLHEAKLALSDFAKDISDFFNRLIPRYGNYGGPGWSGGASGNDDPIDSMDECFKEHDEYYSKGEFRRGDWVLVNELERLPMTPTAWYKPANGMYYSAFYRGAASSYFRLKLRLNMY